MVPHPQPPQPLPEPDDPQREADQVRHGGGTQQAPVVLGQARRRSGRLAPGSDLLWFRAMSPGSARIQPLMPLLRAMLAILALVSQLASGSVSPADSTKTAQFRAIAAFCDGSPGPTTPTHRRHRPNDVAAFPLEAALELPAVILMPAAALPRPQETGRGWLFVLPPQRGPPGTIAWARYARGPPFLA